MKLNLLFLILAAGLLAQQAPPAPASQSVKRISEVHALKLQLLEAQYQLVVRDICGEAGFSMAECRMRPETGTVMRVPPVSEPAKPVEAPKPGAAKPEPPKPAAPKPER